MKAETLLTLTKKCVLCLFLCVVAKDGFGQQVDSVLISKAVVGQIYRIARPYDNMVKILGDSTISKHIPIEFTVDTFRHKILLKKLLYEVDSTSIRITFGKIQQSDVDDLAGIAIVSSVINIDSLRQNMSGYEVGTPLLPAEEESFWDDALQPILVTAGAAAVIALFFFVKF